MAREFVNNYPSCNDFPTKKVLIIADSRGRLLDLELSSILRCEFRIVTCSGADLINSISQSKSHISETEWSQIYCIAGICGITYKNEMTRKVALRSRNPEATAQQYEQSLILAEKKIRRELIHQDCKIIFAPLTGMSLKRYNHNMDVFNHSDDELLLNNTVKLVNRAIVRINEANSVATPWMSRVIHRRHRKSFMNSYHRLSEDGCHLSPEIRLSWASALKCAIINNMADNC